MARLSTSFVLGYHGCDKATADALVAGAPFRASANTYDWLGPGVYFWEANPLRGLQFAREALLRKRKAPKDAAVVGAAIDLGNCLDLSSATGIEVVKTAYRDLKAVSEQARVPMPTNRMGPDLLLRELDCAVITYLHESREASGLEPVDTVRGAFIEGNEIYEGSGFRDRMHTQIAVRNHDCIKGVFRVSAKDLLP